MLGPYEPFGEVADDLSMAELGPSLAAVPAPPTAKMSSRWVFRRQRPGSAARSGSPSVRQASAEPSMTGKRGLAGVDSAVQQMFRVYIRTL